MKKTQLLLLFLFCIVVCKAQETLPPGSKVISNTFYQSPEGEIYQYKGSQFLPNAYFKIPIGAVVYQGVYNAATNFPALPTPSSSNKGWFYVVTTAGIQQNLNLDVNDWVISNGLAWISLSASGKVISVNGKTGTVSLQKDDLGLGNVDNTNDANKPISDATKVVLATLQVKDEKGKANGYASLDINGNVPLSQINASLLGAVNYKGTYNASTNIPALATPSAANKGWYYIVSTPGTQVGLVLNVNDWVISNGEVWGKVDNNNNVTSVAGKTGAVILNGSDIGLGNVDNTSDINKPISTATQIALNGKWNLTGGNSATGDQILTDGSSFIANKFIFRDLNGAGDLGTFTTVAAIPGVKGVLNLSVAGTDGSNKKTIRVAPLNAVQITGSTVNVNLPGTSGTLINRYDLNSTRDSLQLKSEKGSPNGYASLDASGTVPIAQIQSSLNDYVTLATTQTISGQKTLTGINRFSQSTSFGSTTDNVQITSTGLQKNVGGIGYPLALPSVNSTIATVSDFATGKTLGANITGNANTSSNSTLWAGLSFAGAVNSPDIFMTSLSGTNYFGYSTASQMRVALGSPTGGETLPSVMARGNATPYATQITGTANLSSVKSLELRYDNVNDISYLGSYDRSASVYKPMVLAASSFNLAVGNVGIGLSTPFTKLHVNNSAALGTYPTLGTWSGAFGISNYDNVYGLNVGTFGDGNTWMQSNRNDGVATAYNIILQPAGGNIGIGTTTPNSKLEVAGTIRGVSLSTSPVGSVSGTTMFDSGFNNNQGSAGISQIRFDTPTRTNTQKYIDASGNIMLFSDLPAPASSTSTGKQGEVRRDGTYVYFCIAANIWVRAISSAW